MSSNELRLATKMNELRQRYLEQLEPRVESLKGFILACKDGRVTPEIKKIVREMAHKLAGSGATYGFSAISVCAEKLEETIENENAELNDIVCQAQYLLGACVNARGSMSLHKRSREKLSSPPVLSDTAELPLILCVDDDESIRVLVLQIFYAEAEVVLAENGYKALDFLSERTPDIVLLDDEMPYLTGMELLNTLQERKSDKKTAVVMLTANKSNKEVIQAFKFGIADYVVKPFEPAAFHARVMALLERIARKILIADDDEAIIELLGGKLETLGFKVDVARTSQELLERVLDGKPDLMVLDRMLPGGDSLSIFMELKKNPETQDVPVLFLTAKRRENDMLEAFRLGAQDYVIKPFKVDEVIARCMRLMNVKSNR